jgi:glycosyltransferase involved in cell wall biosynthesis
MGRFVPEKGLADLLEATALLIKNNPSIGERVRVLLIGSGSDEMALRSKSAQLGIADHLIFTGVVPHRDAGRYMNALDVFVLPSRTLPNWKEQFGRVIVEAMACQVPVIGSDSGEIPNLIRATGGGVVFREGDTSDLADKMTELGESPAKRHALGEVGAQTVATCYSLGAVATKLQEIFRHSIELSRKA